jgi:hypothetical protein
MSPAPALRLVKPATTAALASPPAPKHLQTALHVRKAEAALVGLFGYAKGYNGRRAISRPIMNQALMGFLQRLLSPKMGEQILPWNALMARVSCANEERSAGLHDEVLAFLYRVIPDNVEVACRIWLLDATWWSPLSEPDDVTMMELGVFLTRFAAIKNRFLDS